jgi:hypothetical protein
MMQERVRRQAKKAVGPDHCRDGCRASPAPPFLEQNFRAPTVVFEGRTEVSDMNRRSLLTRSVPTMLAAALLPSSVVAQEISLKELVGSWIFVSAQDVKPDGIRLIRGGSIQRAPQCTTPMVGLHS